MGPADPGDPTVAVVGDDDGVARTVEETVGTPVATDVDSAVAAEPAVTVAVGEAAMGRLARRRPGGPVLPVAAGGGLRSVPPAAVGRALDRYGSDAWRTETHPLVSVAVDGDVRESALLDATLVTAEPARISEFTVTSGGESVARVRADGVVAATPAGTGGYARAVGVPTIPPGLGVLAVAPIAPFTTDPGAWILPDEGLAITVQRDEEAIAVLADDRTVAEGAAGTTVRIDRDGTVQTVVVPESASPFGDDGAELEKH